MEGLSTADSSLSNHAAKAVLDLFVPDLGVVGVTEMFRCPNGHLGWIDEEQAAGDVSIICNSCDFHGYVVDGEVEA